MRTKTAKPAKAAKPATAKSASDAPSKTIAGTTPEHNGQPVCEDGIRLLAYKKWEAAGKPDGDGIEFWLEAERELLAAK
jgi:hypothetical protein